MRSLGRSVRRKEDSGQPMPTVFPELSALRADARRGEMLMLVGQPASGKTLVAQWMTLTWAMRDNLRGLYFSADSTITVAASRAAAMRLGLPLWDVEHRMQQGDEEVLGALDDITKHGFEWCFDSEISAESLELNIEAFVEKYGSPPAWMCIDNMSDCVIRDGDEFGALRAMARDLNFMARSTGAATIVLHHTSEAEKEDPLPARKSIHGKLAVKPSVILATSRSDGNKKPIGVLKSRYGPDDRSGRTAVEVPFNPSTLRFGASA